MFYDERSTLKKREQQCQGVKHCAWEADGVANHMHDVNSKEKGACVTAEEPET